MNISLYKNIKQTTGGVTSPILSILEAIKNGRWKAQTEQIKAIKEKEVRQKTKAEILPYFTASGEFSNRSNAGLVKHSGLICLDFDDQTEIPKDDFIFASFMSVSGTGFAVLVKIPDNNHLGSFLSLEEYFYKTHGLICDKACKDVARARFVSYDPNLYVNNDSKVFRLVATEKKLNPKKIPQLVTGQGDLDFLIQQIQSSGVNLTQDSYQVWRDIGFSIAAEHGENGRDLFHIVSSNSSRYDYKQTDKQYNACLKSRGHGIGYGTFMYYCKNAGLQLVSEETKRITAVSLMTKKAGRGVGDAVKVLKEIEGIEGEGVEDLVKKTFNSNINTNPLSKLESLEIFLANNFNFKRNVITRFIECEGMEVDSRFLNTIYIRARKEVDDKVKFEEIDRLIGSDFSENYNPLLDFIEKNKNYSFSNEIEKLCNSINSIQNFDYKYLFIRKFLVGIISSIYGDPSPLCLVLCGGQNSGKTTFWNNLLPSELHSYYAESKLDSNKPTDDELLMTQKLLIMDDEFGGKNKTEAKRLKELTSKRAFTLREPYGRKNVTISRTAVLCGTSNERQILNDPTGNRRIIPLEVISFDFQLLNSIDRISLFMEAVYWYNEGVTYHTNKEEIAYLNGNTQQFEQIRPEQELLQRYFRNPNDGESASFMSAMDIKVYLEKATQQRIILPKLVFELEQLNYMRIQKEGRTGYNVRLTEYDYAIESRVAPF